MREAQIDETPEGRVPVDDGWFILNLAQMAWQAIPGFGVALGFDGPDHDPDEPGIGVHVHVLQPGEANGYYHAEAAQEGFLVLSGECIAVVEGQERRMRQWDYLHSPAGTEHITVGAGEQPCAILMFGSPDPARKVEWIANEVGRQTRRECRANDELWEPGLRRDRDPARSGASAVHHRRLEPHRARPPGPAIQCHTS